MNFRINELEINSQDIAPFYDIHRPNRHAYINVEDQGNVIVITPSTLDDRDADAVVYIPSTLPSWEINNLMDMIRDRIENAGDVSSVGFFDLEDMAQDLRASPIDNINDWWTCYDNPLDVNENDIINDVNQGYIHGDYIVFFPYSVEYYLRQLREAQSLELEKMVD